MTPKSRAEYFRKRREIKGQFIVMVDKEILARLDKILKQKGLTRAAWLRKQIAEEIGEQENWQTYFVY
jgi:predicted DNA-binding protein